MSVGVGVAMIEALKINAAPSVNPHAEIKPCGTRVGADCDLKTGARPAPFVGQPPTFPYYAKNAQGVINHFESLRYGRRKDRRARPGMASKAQIMGFSVEKLNR